MTKYELIISEKPKAALKIAQALADGKPIKRSVNKVPYYEITHGNKDIIVGCAVGHLYGLTQKSGEKYGFPIFDIEWKPTSETSKTAKFSKKYLNVLKKLAKDASEFTVATDYDVEGEVIGLNVIRFICKKKDANRMKFSTLTKQDLIKAYENKTKHLDWGQANAGETRHKMDWFYGINTSRALTSAIKSIGSFKVMSTGRVQGPALKLIVDKEKEIKAFIPVKYWQIQLDSTPKTKIIESWHEKDKFWEKKEAQTIHKKIKSEKTAIVKEIKRKEFQQAPPFPFDLTSLQIEAHKTIHISPKKTLEIAQELYTNGWISYPRTSSQKLPKEINYKKIITALGREGYKKESDFLLKKSVLKPNEGKKSDPAHPAIYPTGIPPKGLEGKEEQLYDLIARRFLATFGDPATRETLTIKIDCKQEIFIAKGTTTKEKGWHTLYGSFVMLKELELPDVKEGQVLKVKKITLHEKETKPPKRYTQASIIKELEKRNLGTKATRASILETLLNRGYINGKPLQATILGIKTSDTLTKYSPTIVDEALTRHFEVEMEKILQGKAKSESILKEAKKAVTKISEDMKKHEKKIGKNLKEANYNAMIEASRVGPCPVCKDGELQIRKGKFGRFIACNKYPDCKTTFNVPNTGFLKTTEKVCPECNHPMIQLNKRIICINPKCPSKKLSKEEEKNAKKVEAGKIEKKCPKCENGKLVLRQSVYGKFYGCSNYPKCRCTEKIENNKKEK